VIAYYGPRTVINVLPTSPHFIFTVALNSNIFKNIYSRILWISIHIPVLLLLRIPKLLCTSISAAGMQGMVATTHRIVDNDRELSTPS
jgi:hypothetical protein